jgi:general secretion pathway protein G
MGVVGESANRRQTPNSGFTLLELIVVILIISVLVGLFINRALEYQEQAEKTAMQQVEGAIQSALMLQYGQIKTRGKSSDIAALTEINPIELLQKKPPNYSGEFFDPTQSQLGAGNWAFDLKSHELVYAPRNAAHFKPGKDGNKWIRFHVLARAERSPLPSLTDQPAELTGLLFEPVEPYVWF